MSSQTHSAHFEEKSSSTFGLQTNNQSMSRKIGGFREEGSLSLILTFLKSLFFSPPVSIQSINQTGCVYIFILTSYLSFSMSSNVNLFLKIYYAAEAWHFVCKFRLLFPLRDFLSPNRYPIDQQVCGELDGGGGGSDGNGGDDDDGAGEDGGADVLV